jgi:hypothetical protein
MGLKEGLRVVIPFCIFELIIVYFWGHNYYALVGEFNEARNIIIY